MRLLSVLLLFCFASFGADLAYGLGQRSAYGNGETLERGPSEYYEYLPGVGGEVILVPGKIAHGTDAVVPKIIIVLPPPPSSLIIDDSPNLLSSPDAASDNATIEEHSSQGQ